MRPDEPDCDVREGALSRSDAHGLALRIDILGQFTKAAHLNLHLRLRIKGNAREALNWDRSPVSSFFATSSVFLFGVP